MSESAPAPSAPASTNASAPATASERLIAGIGDDFDLDAPDAPEPGSEPTRPTRARPEKPAKPAKPAPTSLEEADFADDEPPTAAANTPRPHPQEAPKPEPTAPEDPEKFTIGPPDRGTKEHPLSFKDLPEDRFITIKVDGKEETLSLREAVRGFIRKETFQRTYFQVNENAQKALQLANRSLEYRNQVNQQVQQLFANPEALLELCMQNDPAFVDNFARHYAQKYLKPWQDNPEARAQFEYERRMRGIQQKEAQTARERQEWQAQQEHLRLTAERRAVLEPGYREGMKLAGFPQLTDEMRDHIQTLCAQVSKRKGELTANDVRDAVVAVAKLHGAKTVQERRPAPVANPPREPARTPARPNGKGKDWSQVPYQQRMRSADFFLQRR